MPPAGIVGLGSHVPSKVMTNEDWAGLVETSDEWITTKTGIKERRIADPTSARATGSDRKPAGDRGGGLSPDDIDMLILATSSPDVPLSSTAGITQHKLGCKMRRPSTSTRYALVGYMRWTSDQDMREPGLLQRPRNWIGSLQQDPELGGQGDLRAFRGRGWSGRSFRSRRWKGVLGSWMMSDGSGSDVIEIPAGGVRTPPLVRIR